MYNLKKKGKNYLEHTIEKTYEQTITFTMSDILAHQERLTKALKEFTAQLEIESAKVYNISSFHPWVAKLKPEELHTANMFYEAQKQIAMIRPKLKEIKAQIKEYKVEKKVIMSELGFKEDEIS